MPANDEYRRQVSLLIRVIPLVAEEACFALKGGTAINLFIRDMPRLSVDIDLAYLPVADRQSSLADIDAAMRRIAARAEMAIPGVSVHLSPLEREGAINKIVVRLPDAQVKVEVSPVLRGVVGLPERRTVAEEVEDAFGFAEMNLVSHADLYAGKIVAALDRQHPRDLFDVHYLLANEGVDDALREAVIVYLISHNRPLAEVLSPARKDIGNEFARGFVGMTEEDLPIDVLLEAREALIREITSRMPQRHRDFLISFKRGEPDWTLLSLPDVERLPAVQWRLKNLTENIRPEKRAILLAQLETILKK